MKLTAGFGIAGLLASSLLASMPYYALELRDGSRVYATDVPVRKGRVLMFHRYPDGVYVSLAAGDLQKVVTMEAPPDSGQEKLAPGELKYIGGALEGPGYQPPPQALDQASMAPQMDYGYGYTGYYWGGYVPVPRPPGPVPPSRIGPNGFPILAPPGSPGSVPPPTGPNGFPILAPQPPVASPRQH